MKTEKWMLPLSGGLLGFFTGWCACQCMVTGFQLTLDSPQRLWLVIGAAALICALAFSFRKGGWIPVLLGGGWLLWLWREGDAWNQLLQLIFRISHIYRMAYATPELAVPGSTWNAGIADLPMQVLGSLIALVVCRGVCRGRRTWPAVAAGAFPLVLCLVVINTVPGEKWLWGLLLCLALLVLSAAVRRSSPYQAARLMLITALPVAAFLSCLFLGIPKEDYVNKSPEMREKILAWVESIPARAENTAQQIAAVASGSSGEQVNLKTLGPQTTLRYPVLEVTADVGGVLYLRERDYDSYTGTGWTATPHRSESFDCAAGVEGGSVLIQPRSRRSNQFLPYYPGEGLTLIGGSHKAEETGREYTLERTVLPENWRELVEQRYAGAWESDIVFTATQDKSDYLDAYRYRNLPEETKIRAKELLASILAGEGSATAKAEVIAAYVRSTAEYDRNTGRMPGDREDFALWFLEESETGYCVHFATAAVVLLRAAEIPARYVTGYMVSCEGGEATTVTADMAHAWAEYYEPQLGCWIPLEATPADFQSPSTETEEIPEPETTTRPTEPAPTRPSVPKTEPETDTPGGSSLSLGNALRKLGWILWILIPMALLEGQRRLRLWLRLRGRTRGSANERALKLWQEVRLLAKLRREQAPKRLFDLAQKAKFSQHTLSGEELAEMEQYIMENTAQLQTGPWYEQLVWRYLFAV